MLGESWRWQMLRQMRGLRGPARTGPGGEGWARWGVTMRREACAWCATRDRPVVV